MFLGPLVEICKLIYKIENVKAKNLVLIKSVCLVLKVSSFLNRTYLNIHSVGRDLCDSSSKIPKCKSMTVVQAK